MVDQYDPCGIAAVWQQAAGKVRELRSDDGGEDAKRWNAAIDQAVGVLEREASEVRVMGRMAYLLIVGNVARSPDPSAQAA